MAAKKDHHEAELARQIQANPDLAKGVAELQAQGLNSGSILSLLGSLGTMFGPLIGQIIALLKRGHTVPKPPPAPGEGE